MTINPKRSGPDQAGLNQPKPATGEKCPTCGYQLVTLDNDELAKLTEKAAYHELRQQLAAERQRYVNLQKQLDAEMEKIPPPVDNKYVAEGCEQFGDQEDTNRLTNALVFADKTISGLHRIITGHCDQINQLEQQLAAEREKVQRVKKLAEGNITGCGTCHTILEALK